MYAKLEPNGNCRISDMEFEGSKPLVRAGYSFLDAVDELEFVYHDEGDRITEEVVVRRGRAAVRREIEELKRQLAAGDYKVVKCFESSLAGEPLPYDMASLHSVRQELRERINELENQLFV